MTAGCLKSTQGGDLDVAVQHLTLTPGQENNYC
jgi:hypothetical protein